MFKPTGGSHRPGRIRLEAVQREVDLHKVRMLLVEAQKNKGSLVELPIHRKHPPDFLLTCVYDPNLGDPNWALYEEEGTVMVWNYAMDSIEMIFNMVGMSLTEKDSKTEILPTAPTNQPQAASGAGQTPASAPANYSQAQGQSSLPGLPELNPMGGFSSGTSSSWSPEQSAGGSSQGQQAPWFMSQDSAQQQQAPWNQQQGGSGGQQQQQAPWNQQQGGPGGSQQQQAPWNQQQGGSQPFATGPGSLMQGEDTSAFAGMLDKQSKLTLAELLVGNYSIPAKCLDVAMKLQEMVCRRELTEKNAMQALKLAAQQGGVLTDSILTSVSRADLDRAAVREAEQLLQQAGLVGEVDVKAAEARVDDTTDLGAALVAAGKVDALTVEAARECHELVSSGRLPAGKAMMALHYCQRARAPLKDALSDLSIELE